MMNKIPISLVQFQFRMWGLLTAWGLELLPRGLGVRVLGSPSGSGSDPGNNRLQDSHCFLFSEKVFLDTCEYVDDSACATRERHRHVDSCWDM